MKKFYFWTMVLVLVTAMLACGQSSGGPVIQTQESTPGSVDPTSAPLGSSRTSPAPAGSVVLADQIEFEIVGNTRPATETVVDAHPWNRKPESGEEYIFVALKIRCTKPQEQKCSLFIANLKLVGSSGLERDVIWNIANVENIIEQTDLYGGSTTTKDVPFIIDQGETDLILVYQPLFGDHFYLSVGE